MKYVSEADLRAYLINDGCDDECGYLDERDIPSLPWIELDEDEKGKVGHWIEGVNGHFNCSECNTDFFAFRDIRAAFIYCPYCRARMVEEQKGEKE